MKKSVFIAEKSNFCGDPGYYVFQIVDGREVLRQFVSEISYKDFCKWIGCTPTIKTEK